MEKPNNHDLIESDRVIGTNVYGRDGNHIGTIEDIVMEKRGGRISYAVLSFGGFLGIGDDHYPLPWEKLDYDEDLDGYRIDLTEEEIRDAPSYSPNEKYDWSQENGARVYEHYRLTPYWV